MLIATLQHHPVTRLASIQTVQKWKNSNPNPKVAYPLPQTRGPCHRLPSQHVDLMKPNLIATLQLHPVARLALIQTVQKWHNSKTNAKISCPLSEPRGPCHHLPSQHVDPMIPNAKVRCPPPRDRPLSHHLPSQHTDPIIPDRVPCGCLFSLTCGTVSSVDCLTLITIILTISGNYLLICIFTMGNSAID